MTRIFSFTYQTAADIRHNVGGRVQHTSPIKANSGKPEDAKPRVYVQYGYDSRAAEDKSVMAFQRLLAVSWRASRASKSRFFFAFPPNHREGGEDHEAAIRFAGIARGAQDADVRQRYGGGTQGVVVMI